MKIAKLIECNQFPTHSANQFASCLENCSHQRVRLLKTVHGLVNDPRRWYHHVASDLRNMGNEESLMEPCLWTLRCARGVIQALCVVHVDAVMLACNDSTFKKRIFDGINNVYER